MDTSSPVRVVGFAARLALLLSTQLLISFPAQAQCINQWLPGETAFTELSSRSLIEWDPDGAGPLPKVLAFATTNGVTLWDGANYTLLGTGLYDVRFVTIYNGSLIAATRCPDFSGGGVYRWNGTYWENLGLGLGGSNAYVQTLLPFQNQLIAGGSFSTADRASANSIAAWNGVQWLPIGAGLNNAVWALAEYQGQLVAAGTFTNTAGFPASKIARWDGSFWQALGSGLNDSVYSLAVQETNLYASGLFTASGATSVSRVARWDGLQWQPMSTGLSGQGTVLLNDGAGLIVGGSFATAGGVAATNLARWNGESWSTWTPGVNGAVVGIFRAPDRVYFSGNFTQTQGRTIGQTASWDGEQIRRLSGGFNERVDSLTVMDNEVIVGGNFSTYRDDIVSSVCRFNDGDLISIGMAPCRAVAIAVYNGELYAAGPGKPPLAPNTTNNIWKWNGSTWNAVSTGADNTISKLIVYRGELVAGGSFMNMNGMQAKMFARYDGTTWRSLGGGLTSNGFPVRVFDMTIHNEKLVVTGWFNIAPDMPVEGMSWHIAQWDGTSWSRLGNGATGSNSNFIYGAMSYRGDLYVCGSLSQLNGVNVRGIARWTGTTFVQVGGVTSGSALDMTVYHDRLILSSGVDVGSTRYNGPVAWNGQTWESLGIGVADGFSSGEMVWESTVANDVYYLAGDFQTAGGVPSSRLARWRGTEAPSISQQPQAAASCNHHTAQFTVGASGFSLTYHWEKDSVPIDLLANPTAGSATLQIAFPRNADAGQYACRITNECSSILSAIVPLSVCEPDFNCDQATDFFDYLDFVAAFAASDLLADFNADSIVDLFDYLDFVAEFGAGC